MIERDLKVYLDKVDYYTNQSVDLFEQALRLYGFYTDNSRLESDFIINLKKLSESFRTLYFEVSDYTIDDLAPDPFQDMDASFHSFISICDNLPVLSKFLLNFYYSYYPNIHIFNPKLLSI